MIYALLVFVISLTVIDQSLSLQLSWFLIPKVSKELLFS